MVSVNQEKKMAIRKKKGNLYKTDKSIDYDFEFSSHQGSVELECYIFVYAFLLYF